MANLSESVSKSKKWPMWVGDSADLRRMLRLIQKQYDPLISGHVTAATEHEHRMLNLQTSRKTSLLSTYTAEQIQTRPSISENLKEIEADISEARYNLEQAEISARNAGQITLDVFGRDGEQRTVVGDPDELVEYLEGRYIVSVEMTAPSGGLRDHRIRVRAGRHSGISLSAASSDATWCIAAFAEVEEAIRSKVPRWRLLRHPAILGAVLYAATAVLFWFLGDLIALATTESGKFAERDQGTVYVVWLVSSIIVGTALGSLATRLMPAFEIVSPGKRARSLVPFAFIAYVVASLVLAVGGNALSEVVLGR